MGPRLLLGELRLGMEWDFSFFSTTILIKLGHISSEHVFKFFTNSQYDGYNLDIDVYQLEIKSGCMLK